MKEMLFITVAILIPPSLTYMGFVGGGATSSSHEWQSSQAERSVAPEPQRTSKRDEKEQAPWYESSL